MVVIMINEGTPIKAEDLFEKYRESFGEIIEAEMFHKEPIVDYELILTNKSKDKMHIKTGLTSGYVGAGPHGTLRVLKKAGFNVDEDFVHTHSNFNLKK